LAHYNLGRVLRAQRRFPEAIASFRKALAIAPPGDPLRERAKEEMLQCERLNERDRNPSTVLQGEAEPADTAERLALTNLCRGPYKRLYTAQYPEMTSRHRTALVLGRYFSNASSGVETQTLMSMSYRRLRWPNAKDQQPPPRLDVMARNQQIGRRSAASVCSAQLILNVRDFSGSAYLECP
jgi:hypothetical protein